MRALVLLLLTLPCTAQTCANLGVLRLANYQNIANNLHTFSSDSTAFWYAGANYPDSFAADTWYAFEQVPEHFTAAQINNIVTKFVAQKNGSGDLPIALKPDATAFVYYSGNDNVHAFVTGDGWMFVPQMALLAYQKSGSLTTFSSVSASLKTALQNVPLSGGLVNIPNGQEWVPWGFQDNVKFGGGVNLMGSLGFYASTKAMATLYTAAGDPTNAAIFTAFASGVASNIEASFWNSGDGMYHAATGSNNNQIDIDGSTYACWLGLSTHCSTISAYLVTNYASLTYQGFWRQSNTNWGRDWQSKPAGSYDDGFWSVANQWIEYTEALGSLSQAKTDWLNFLGATNTSQEWYNQDHSTTGGSLQNLESPAGNYAWATANPSIFGCVSSNGGGKSATGGKVSIH